MAEPNTFNSETRLFCTPEQARELAEKLAEQADEAECFPGAMGYVRQDVEQLSKDGPWRLILAIKQEDE